MNAFLQSQTSLDRAVYTVLLAGEIDLSRKPELRALEMGFRLSPATNILIDLTDVTFMDPTGVGALLGLYRIAAKRGGYVTMANPSYTVLRVLEVLALTPLFEIVNRPLSQAGVPSAS